MLHIAGPTAGPIGLTFFVDTHGWPGSVIGKNKLKFFQNSTPGSSASDFILM